MWEWSSHGFAREPEVRAWAWLPSLPEADATTHPGRLSGLRFGVKDVIDVAGMPTCHGIAGLSSGAAHWDAAVVAQLRAAGAVPIGKTVTAECAFTAPGPTRNPHNLLHTPGGSSSGSAAAVAAGMVEFAVGTQTGGSIIRPAAFCGVVGFKPSWGWVHRQGMMVTAESLDTIGWFSADVALSAQVLGALRGHEPQMPALPKRMALIESWPDPLDAATKQLLVRSAQAASEVGVAVEPWDGASSLLSALVELHLITSRYEMATGLSGVARACGHLLSESLKSAVKEGLAISASQYASAQRQRARLAHRCLTELRPFDLLLAPSALGPAPLGLQSTGSSLVNRPWSLLGWPCLHLPLLRNENSLPLGIQLIAKPGEDMALHAMADALYSVWRNADHAVAA